MIIEHRPSFSKETYKLSVIFDKYASGQNAIMLYDLADGFPFMTATAALTNVELESDDVAIKNYSENVGILETLIAANIISKPHSYIPSGYANFPICKILKTA